jgi:alkylated DNA repair dioxygenase AlkB
MQLPMPVAHLNPDMPRKRFGDLFSGEQAGLPAGFLYQPNFLSETEEADLLRTIESLNFGTYDFRGYIAKRRVVAYGGGYESGTRRMAITADVIPEYLRGIRGRAAAVAGMPADDIVQAMVTEYSVGTPIGWHRDSPQFGTIIGVSLRGCARLRLKPWKSPGVNLEAQDGRIISVPLEPRSIYVMSGEARWNFQHSIPAVKDLRYSITLRSLAEKKTRAA